MKHIQLIVISGIALFFAACGNQPYRLTVVNSVSFAEKQITIEGLFAQHLWTDSLSHTQESTAVTQKLDEMISKSKELKISNSDSSWIYILKVWDEFRTNQINLSADTSANSKLLLQKWAELNINLLKFSGEVRFGDELERLVYHKIPVLSNEMLKSVIYTHIYDQIFINVIGSSSLTHYHTTGGTIKLIQKTTFPESNEMTLTCENEDVRYMDVFIRIPGWAIHPTVTHGNVKYVARPGEYCQISRKWKDGDEIRVMLKN